MRLTSEEEEEPADTTQERKEVQAALARVGFTDLRVEPLDDRYCPVPTAQQPGTDSRDGESVALPLYLVRGRVPQS